MRIEITEPKKEGKETEVSPKVEETSPVSIEASSPQTLSIHAKEVVGSSGKMYKGG